MSKRKVLAPEQKVAIVRRHLLENVPVSDLCDEYGIHPTQYYAWQKQLFEQGALVFERQRDTEKNRLKRQVERLEGKVRKKDEVLGELMEEYVTLKKELGAP